MEDNFSTSQSPSSSSSSNENDHKKMEIFKTYELFLENYNKLQSIEDSEDSFKQLETIIIDQIKLLRNSCAQGPDYQEFLINLPHFIDVINSIITTKSNIPEKFDATSFTSLKRMTWQLIANICVQNIKTQLFIWQHFGQNILNNLQMELSPFTDIQLMIIYNIYKGGNIGDHKMLFKLLIQICDQLLQPGNEEVHLDFLHIFLEGFLIEYNMILSLYGPLDAAERIIILQYISNYIRTGSSNGPISKSLMQYLSKEFKKKSDCVLKTVENYLNNIHPKEVITLLDVIAKATGEEIYSTVYNDDHSLFINMGSLLQALNTLGKQSQNIFTPMEKLEQVAPCSKISTDFEKEISFEMKTMLVRSLANLLYRNRKNQDYARELNIIMAILDCTTTDARNPLIKEWSILAIRNLCENSPENQEFISKLFKVGDAPNEILTELSLELGSLRIRSNA